MPAFNRLRIFLAVASTVVFSSSTLLAETELFTTHGSWIPVLVDYDAGSIVTNGGGTVVQPNLYNNNQADFGFRGGLRGLRSIAGTTKKLEFSVNLAGINTMASSTDTFFDPNASTTVWLANLDGNAFLATPDGGHATFSLDSDVLHYSEYIGIRNRWDSADMEIGFGFSHMGFDQDFSLNAAFSTGSTGQYIEDLDTDYFGGQIRTSRTRHLLGRNVNIDLNLGLYGMNGDYRGTSIFRNGVGTIVNTSNRTDTIKKLATTVELNLSVDSNFRGIYIRPGLQFKYISDMVEIEHPQTITLSEPVRMATDGAFIFGTNLQILL